VTDGLAQPPQYFPHNVKLNKEGYESLDEVMHRGTQPLSAEAFEATANETGAVVLDTRPATVFHEAFVPNSVNIGLNGQFAPWVGALIPDLNQEILLVTEPGQEEETILRLARVGYDHVVGYLDGGIAAWEKAGKEVDAIESISADELADRMTQQPLTVVDVRRPGEFAAEHVDGAQSLPLDFINENMAEFPKDQPVYLHCAGGYRSMIAASILKARGYEHLIDVAGGVAAIQKTGRFTLTDYVCPNTLK